MTVLDLTTDATVLVSDLLQLVSENVADVLALIEPCEPFRVLWANPQFYQYIQHPEGPVIGCPWREIFSASAKWTIFQIFQSVAETGEPFEAVDYEVLGLDLGKKYELPDALTYWTWKLLPINQPNSKDIAAMLFTLRDVTETKLWRLEKKRLETILDTIPTGVIVVEGAECKVALANRRATELLGQKPELGLPLTEYMTKLRLLKSSGQLYPVEELPLYCALSGETVRELEMLIEQPDGQRMATISTASPLRDDAGNIVGAVGAFEDITLLKKAQGALRNAYFEERGISETLQEALLPRVPRQIDGFLVASSYSPACTESHVGGDFYDIFRPAPGLLSIVIGDVSGKGVNAAIRTALTKHTLRAYAYEDPAPSSVLKRLNKVLAFEADETFVTLFYGLIDVQNRTLVFSNAGHEPPLCLNHSSGEIVLLIAGGMALGILNDQSYSQSQIQLAAGDKILLYTDGVTDAKCGDTFFGVMRLKEIFSSGQNKLPSEFITYLSRAVREFSGGYFQDDVALLLICAE